MNKLFIFSFFFFTRVFGQAVPEKIPFEFFYPVSQFDDETVMVVHQKSVDDIELLFCSTRSGAAIKELNSMFLPAFVQFLPSKKAYSFIDRGTVRIKNLSKRTPKTVYFYDTISSVFSMNWLSDEQFCLVAQSHGKLTLFLCDIADREMKLYSLSNDDADYAYPCKIEDDLFCVVKNQDGHSVVQMKWQPELCENGIIKNSDRYSTVLCRSSAGLCFLNMITDKLGFVLEYQQQNSNLCKFSCLQLWLDDELNSWQIKKIFEFSIPDQFLIGNSSERIYESLYPFAPRYMNSNIYFTDFDQRTGKFVIYKFNQETAELSPISLQIPYTDHTKNIFAPFPMKDNLCCGFFGPISTLRSLFSVNAMNGIMYCDLPKANS